MQITRSRAYAAEPTQIPENVFERLLEKYPTGYLPKAQFCYYTLIVPKVGKPYVIPDFLISNVMPEGFEYGKALRSLRGLAPYRGSRIRQWVEGYFLRRAVCLKGFVAWIPQSEVEDFTLEGVRKMFESRQVPDFAYSDTVAGALEKFL